MILLEDLKEITQKGCRALEKKSEVKEAEVYASANTLNVLRIAFASNVPSNALEEPKSMQDFGLSVRIVFSDGKIGFGKHDSSLSMKAIEIAYQKAKKNRVSDPDFKSLPEPSKKKPARVPFDKQITGLEEEKAVSMAYDALDGAIDFLEQKKFTQNINITGELDFLEEKMSVTNTNGVNASDRNTSAIVTLTTILELERDISGMWFDSSVFMKKINPYETGVSSAQKALKTMHAKTIPSGEYKVIFGSLAVAQLVYSRLELGLQSVELNATPYNQGMLDKQVFSEQLTVHDNGLLEGSIGTKSVTDEGHPTQKTLLIEKGRLVNFLANDYYKKKFPLIERTYPANGFRFGGGGRNYDGEPGIHATNIEIEGGGFSEEELAKEVKNGVYIGRLWYTYPVNGLASADFTSTVRGDSFIIKDGQINLGIVPNTLRINENLTELLSSIIGLGKQKKQTIAWGEETVVVTPEIAVNKARLEKIAVGLYS